MDTQEEISLKVTDRRHFTAEGERRADVPEPAPGGETAGKAGDIPAAAANSATPIIGGAAETGAAAPPPSATAPPQPDAAFLELLDSLYATTMLQMGAPAQPGAPAGTPDLISARQTIDWIAALEMKTRGNLALQEKEFFESVLYNLRLTYVELTRKLSGQAPPRANAGKSRK